MTGVNYRKIRHYSPVTGVKSAKEDVNLRAQLFREANSILVSQERLIAEVSIKTAMPTSSNSDGKKRGLESSKGKYVNSLGMVYDPSGKWAPGKIFKPYVTETERIQAMKMKEPNPNWGWLDSGYDKNTQSTPKNVFVKITEHSVNPRTGEASGVGVEIKAALGRTIRDMKPGQNLGARAAKAFGVIVDSLGKFRCPPGTPAANRFTNERGEGCFSFGQSAQNIVSNIVSNLGNTNEGDRGALTQGLLRAGVSAFDIRETFKNSGVAGLRSMIQAVRERLVGDDYVDSSYKNSVLKKIISRSADVEKSVSGIRRETEKRQIQIDEMLNSYGIEQTEDNSDIVELLKRMSNDGLFSESFDASDLFIGGDADSHRTAMIDHLFGELQGTRLDENDKSKYLDDVANNRETPLTQYVDAVLKREQDYQRGLLQGIVRMQQQHPDSAKKVSLRTLIGDGGQSNPSYHAETGWSAQGDYLITINPEAALKGLPPFPGGGKSHLYSAEGGNSQEEQWLAIANELSHHEKMRTWVESHLTDLAAAQGNGWEDFGAEVGIHEFMHVLQFEKLMPLVEKYSGKKITELTNDEIADFQSKIVISPSSLGVDSETLFSDIKEIYGTDIFDLIERRLDALAGSYSQDEQQRALQFLQEFNRTGDLEELDKYNQTLTVALLETLAELGTAREMGLINGKEIDEVLTFADPQMEITPAFIDAEPSRPTLWVPGPGGTWVENRKPNPPIDSPTPVVPSRPRPQPIAPNLVDTSVDEKALEDAWGLNAPDPSGVPATREDLKNTPGRGRRSRITKKIADGFLSDEDAKKHEEEVIKYLTGKGGRFQRSWNETRQIMDEMFGTNDISELTDEQILDFQDALRQRSAESRERLEQLETMLARGQYPKPDPNDRTTDRNGSEDLQYQITKEKNRARALSHQMSSIGDIYDIRKWREKKVLPDREIPFYMKDFSTISRAQRKLMTPEEQSVLDGAFETNPQIGRIVDASPNTVRSAISEEQQIIRAYTDNGLEPPESPTTSPSSMLKNAQILSAIDKSEVKNDIVVEFEIDAASPGSVIEVSDITRANVINEPDSRSGLSSRSLGIAANLIGSQRSKNLMKKMGVDDRNAEMLTFVSSMALAFGSAGPAGVATVLLRRGGRDAADYGLRKAVQEGWIEPSIASKLESQILNRVAPEGLPKEITEALERSVDYMVTDSSKARARELLSAVEGRLSDFDVFGTLSEVKESISDFETAQRVSETASSARDRLRKIRNRGRVDEMLSSNMDFNDPFYSPPTSISTEYDDPFKSLNSNYLTINTKQEKLNSSRKEKVRIVVPAGSRGALVNVDNKNPSIMLPPGKIKLNVRDEEGFITGEIESQKTTEDYLKSIENSFGEFVSDPDYDVRKFASESANSAKKMLRDRKISRGTTSKDSKSSKITLEKSEEVIREAMNKGFNPFKSEEISNGSNVFPIDEVYLRYEKAVREGISLAKSERKKLFSDKHLSEKADNILKTKSEDEIRKIITDFAVAIHEGFDRRVRLNLSSEELEYLAENGKIKTTPPPPSVSELKKRKNISIGIGNKSTFLDSISAKLIHISEIDKIEESLYSKGTRIGSEEFHDDGSGINVVLKPENSLRIGYGKMGKQNYAPIFVGLTDDDEQQIELSIFGDIDSNPENSSNKVIEILESISNNDVDSILKKNGQKVFEALIVGDVSLDDIEHVKIPSEYLGVKNSPIPSDDPIAGDETIKAILTSRGASVDKIQSFINEGGISSRNPRHLHYLREIPKASEVKEKLVSSGVPEVLFTNKNGIDIMSDSTWGKGQPSSKLKSIDRLTKLAEEEIEKILDTVHKESKGDKK